jgi:hypothetical protein
MKLNPHKVYIVHYDNTPYLVTTNLKQARAEIAKRRKEFSSLYWRVTTLWNFGEVCVHIWENESGG